MKINKIQIGNFGKFENYNINFEDGFNIIYGNNEDGKSTIMAFIKMMFYGSTGKSSDLSKNVRKKYMPWNGAKMSGAIEFEDKGINYRVEKVFGASNATDKINLWNKTTGEKEKIASVTDIGQRFFCIGAAAFEKSVFISQIGSTISNEADKEDEITQKLLNLVSTGDESVSEKKVVERLRSAKEALKSKSGKIGALDKFNRRLEALSSERIEALEDEEKKKQLEQQYISLAKEEEKLKAAYELNKSQYNTQEKLADLEKLEDFISKKRYIDNLADERNLKNEQLKTGDIIFDNEFVKNCEEQISQIQTLKRLYDEKNENVKSLENENAKLKAVQVCEINKECIETVKAKREEQSILQKSMDTLKDSIKEASEFVVKKDKGQASLIDCEKRLDTIIAEKQKEQNNLEELEAIDIEAENTVSALKKKFEYQSNTLNTIKKQKEDANAEYQVAVNNTKYVEKLSNQRVDNAREKYNQVSATRQVVTNENAEKIINKPLLAASIVILIISIILGIAVHPIGYAGIVAAVILGIVSCSKTKSKATTRTIIADEEEIAKAKENLIAAKSDSDKENRIAFEAEQAAEKALKELETKAELLESEVSKLEKEYTKSSQMLSQVKQKINEFQVKLEFVNEKISAAEAEIACEKNEFEQLLNGNREAADIDIQKLKLQLDENAKAEAELKDDIDKILKGKNCKTIDELQSKHVEWQNYETKLFAKAEELEKSICAVKEAKDNLEFGMKKLFETVSQYTPVSSLEDVVKAIAELKDIIGEISTINIKINSQTEFLNNEIQGKTVQQLMQHMDEVREEVLKLNNGIMPLKCNELELEKLKQLKEDILEQIQKIKEESIQLNSTIKHQFIGKKNVSEVDEEIYQLKGEILEKANYYECLDVAESTINEAFNEISQSFGPLLNNKTTEIFNSLTDGKYENVIISRNFDINVQNAEGVTSHEWKYLSNGTIDQAYFALRLSISDLFSNESMRLPLMLDDVFLQYDEGRAMQGLKFLVDYSKRDGLGAQIIMFTCQKSIIHLAEENSSEIIVKSISDFKE